MDKKTALTRALKEHKFESLACLSEDIDCGDDYIPVIDDEEMTIHEFRLMKAEELILDPILEEVMDTTLRVGIGDRIYKITEHGTFSAPKGQLIALEKEIANFNTTLISNCEIGSSVSLNDGVVFVNSFGTTRVPVIYTFPNRDMVNKTFKLPADYIYGKLKGLAGEYVYTPLKERIQPKDPRMAYFIWGEANCTFKEDNSYIMGVKEYENLASKTIRFDRSGGFTFNNGAVSGFVPTEFIIKDLDMFAACYYNGKWKGIRFTI